MTDASSAVPAPAPRHPVALPGVVVLVGVLVVLLLGLGRPDAAGARTLTEPATLLAVLDTVWLLALCAPGRATPWDRAVVAAVGAPFHVAAAAAAGVGSGHAWAVAIVALGFTAAAAFVRPDRRVALSTFAVALFGLPLAAYALADLLAVEAARAWIAGSPLTAPTLFARATEDPSGAEAWPALAVSAAVILAALIEDRWIARGREAR